MMVRSELDGVLMNIQIKSISLIQSHGDGLLTVVSAGVSRTETFVPVAPGIQINILQQYIDIANINIGF